jgi:alkaline phosphatase D
MEHQEMQRRDFLKFASLSPAFIRLPQSRPQIADGVQIGDALADRAMIWARSDRDSTLLVEYATTDSFRNSRRIRGPSATAATDFTARVDLRNLLPGQTTFFRVQFEDRDGRALSETAQGSFRTAPRGRSNLRFVWSGDTVGQGFGINPERGGMRIYETMRGLEPNFFIHSGDTIYADDPVPAEVRAQDGSVWRNITSEAKSKVAETIEEFRGNYRYNLMDENVRRFNSQVPQIWQWDDHEVLNNWSPGKDLSSDMRYKVKDIGTLAARARQAFLEYAPMRFTSPARRIYRRIPYGPLVDVFVLDLRSYRAANSYNGQEQENLETTYLGQDQLNWFQQELKASRAVWKVIASDMPIGLMIADGRDAQNRPRFENAANGDGPARGRELEIARILRFVQRNAIRNLVWLTTDVHYTAAHFYDPAKAQMADFNPFWEFVSGPLNAISVPASQTDNTFGIQVVFQKAPPPGQFLPPSAGFQFFGEVLVEGRTALMTVNLRDAAGAILFSRVLEGE